MRETYPQLCAGTAPRIVQDRSQASYFGGRRPADGVIDWQRRARDIYNLVPAVTHPYPGAFRHWRPQPPFIWPAQIAAEDGAGPAAPGTVVAIDQGLVIQTGAGRLRALRVQSAGEDEADAAAWAAAHGVAAGTVLG